MTSRTFKTVRLLSIVALAPLLAAPKGCHFGSDEVPLGSNADDGEAGAGVGSDGSGGSSTTGGTGSANGGSPTNGGTSGSSTGGTGAATPASGPCIEVLTDIAGDTSDPPFGFNLIDLHELLAGRHRTMLATRNTAPTNVTLEFVGPIRVFYVESRPNPDFTLDIVVECNNHIRAKTFARFVSDDGVFDETFPELELNVGLPDAAAGAVQAMSAGGALSLERDELRGSYYPPIPDSQCLEALQFHLTISEAEFTGLLIEEILGAPCGSNEPDLAVLSSELGTWRCQGESCRLPPNDTVVVEAASCDRFGGRQITRSGDEASFARTGDVLTREQSWGCGSPTRAEHVMVYAPSSPLELRLCHDNFADTAEAVCRRALSYDLSTALRRAGTSEFRFVD